MNLSPEQKRILLTLCNAAEAGRDTVHLIVTQGTNPIRETTTGAALVRKGLATRHRNGEFSATDEGFWLGDSLRIEERQGKIPARRK